ncbi:hypothetical protein CICLE_v10017339mg [Citrus x clementina]|uniref:Uncharacterized protein n=1 Tax=Citrus clementina TaxID=85681 RepID=V4UAZ1_CITCL|nr:hypothetical protein CICLE_v10017339mg [Citrus x clementina]
MVSAQFKFLKTSTFWGWFFNVIGSAFFLGFLFAAIISKLLPLSNNPLLSAIQNDRYYSCFMGLVKYVIGCACTS